MLTLRSRLGILHRLAFAPDGRGLVAAGVGVWAWADVSASGPSFRWDEAPVHGVGYVAGGRHLLVTAVGRGLWRLDPQTGDRRQLAVFLWGTLAVSADGTFAAVYDGHAARLSGWAIGSDDERRVWAVGPVDGGVGSGPTLTPDGAAVIAPNPDAAGELPVCVWESATGRPLGEHPMPHGCSTGIAVHPDGKTIAFGSGRRLVVGSIAPGAGPATVIRLDTTKHLTAVAFHPSGRWLVAASNDTTVRLFDTGGWGVAKTFTWNAGRVRCLAFSPDGSLVAAGTDKGTVMVWDVDE